MRRARQSRVSAIFLNLQFSHRFFRFASSQDHACDSATFDTSKLRKFVHNSSGGRRMNTIIQRKKSNIRALAAGLMCLAVASPCAWAHDNDNNTNDLGPFIVGEQGVL